MIGGNGWCGWPATGGGSALEYWEQWIDAPQFGYSPTQDAWREQQYYNAVLNGDQYSIWLNKEALINSRIYLHDSADYTDLSPEVKLYWQEQRGSHGQNYEFKAGIVTYENKQLMNISANLAAASTVDQSANDDDIIITDLTANLDIQEKPNPLTGNPLFSYVWLYRGSDQASGAAIIYGLKIRYKISL